jgi:IS1 family transposase
MLERLKYNNIMNKLTTAKRVQIVSALVEGNSLRSTARMSDTAFNTVLKLLPEIGKACAKYQDKVLRNLPCKRVQCDEIHSFVYAKQKNLPDKKVGEYGFGDVWTWVAICADSKLVPCWLVGRRDGEYARLFIENLASRLANRVQLTTDGLRAYLEAVEGAFGSEIDYSMLVKLYTGDPQLEGKYSPGECCGTRTAKIIGNPKSADVSTSYVERQNLTMRMCMRRFTRLTNAFSKKIQNHEHAIALHYMHYNFAKIHKTLRVTPAMAAGISDHVWSLEEIVDLIGSK